MKSLVLDVDGVIIRDRLLLSHVKENCVNYVRHKMPECKDPVWANKTMYLTHGHTGRGLQETFRKDVSDFNSFVYDKSLLSHLSEVIYSPEFQEDAKEIHDWTTRGCWR